MESSVVMAMEYLVLEVKYLVKSGFKSLKFMVKVKRSLNSMSYGDRGLNNKVV
jgi:hypothetical protein